MRPALTVLLAILGAFGPAPDAAHATPPYEPPVCVLRAARAVAYVDHRNVVRVRIPARLIRTNGPGPVQVSHDLYLDPDDAALAVAYQPVRQVRPGPFVARVVQRLPRSTPRGTRFVVRVLVDGPEGCGNVSRSVAVRAR